MKLLCLALALATAPAADDPAADAEAAYAAGDYDSAAAGFAALYAESGDPAHKYAEAQALRLAGRDAEAALAYDAFIADANGILPSLDEATRETVTLMIGNAEVQARGCRERAPVEPDPAPSDEPPEPEPDPDPEPEPAEEPAPPPPVLVAEPQPTPDRAPRRRDPATIALLSSGAVVSGAGIGLLVAAAVLDGNASNSSHDAYTQEIQRATTQQRVGFALTGLGAALLTGGIVRAVVVRRQRGTARASLWPAVPGAL
ncbi:MAG: hypothetical protein AAGA54_11295 [Myxococcota bacterium]